MERPSLEVVGTVNATVSENRMRGKEEEGEEDEEKEEEECLYWPVKYSSNEAGAGREVGMERSPQESEQHIFWRHMGTAEHRWDTETKEGEKSFQCACRTPACGGWGARGTVTQLAENSGGGGNRQLPGILFGHLNFNASVFTLARFPLVFQHNNPLLTQAAASTWP